MCTININPRVATLKVSCGSWKKTVVVTFANNVFGAFFAALDSKRCREAVCVGGVYEAISGRALKIP